MMRKDKKYMMIVTEEDERYDGNNIQISFYSDNPFEGKLSDIVYGNNIDELRKSSDGHNNEGLFYVLYSTLSGDKIGYGIVDYSSIAEEIEEYKNKINVEHKFSVSFTTYNYFEVDARTEHEAIDVAKKELLKWRTAYPNEFDEYEVAEC